MTIIYEENGRKFRQMIAKLVFLKNFLTKRYFWEKADIWLPWLRICWRNVKIHKSCQNHSLNIIKYQFNDDLSNSLPSVITKNSITLTTIPVHIPAPTKKKPAWRNIATIWKRTKSIPSTTCRTPSTRAERDANPGRTVLIGGGVYT